jgi:hypothetical protein
MYFILKIAQVKMKGVSIAQMKDALYLAPMPEPTPVSGHHRVLPWWTVEHYSAHSKQQLLSKRQRNNSIVESCY